MVQISPHYEEIKARAWDILTGERFHSISSYGSVQELAKPGNKWVLRNAVGVALCKARDEIAGPMQHACRPGHFNIGNFQKAQREITKRIKSLR